MPKGKRRGRWRGGSENAAKRKREDPSGGAQAERQPQRWDRAPVEKNNEAFNEYYKRQGIVPEDQWDAFLGALREDLPVVFRVAGVRSLAQDISKVLEETYFCDLQNIDVGEGVVEPPRPLAWYPGRVAWQINLSRKVVRKSEKLNYFHKFLVRESEQGNITRQEAVSMIPPLLLDVQPHHKVLDMCAAPGSKTAQLIEMMHSKDGSSPSGLLVANDKDNKRCYMLVHQTKRLNSPCLVVLNEDASCIPNLCLDEQRKKPVLFDRILCDVPCSGDGTMRKNPEVWRKWSSANGNGLHRLQLRILRRGLEMLAVGGRLVYSTCAFNPIEDEAVVSAMLEQCKGAVELVDCSNDLPDLKREPGLSSWHVKLKDGQIVSSYDEVPEDIRESAPRSLFSRNDPEDHLERCWRVLPHRQNTGGFFIVAMRKVAPLPWMKATEPVVETKTEGEATPCAEVSKEKTGTEASGACADSAAAAPVQKFPEYRSWHKGFKEAPFVFFKDTEDPFWTSIKDFFQLEGIEPSQLLLRSHGGRKRAVYMASPIISQLVPLNEAFVKVVNTGVRVFGRSTQAGAACEFRVVQEGLHAILPHINARRIAIRTGDALRLLKNWCPQTCDLSKDIQKAVDSLVNGSCVLTLPAGSPPEADSEDPTTLSGRPLSCPLHFSAWKSKYTVRMLVTKDDRAHFLMMLGQGKVEDIQTQVDAQMKELEERNKAKKAGGDDDDAMLDDDESPAETKVAATTTESAENQVSDEVPVAGDV